MGDNLTGGGLTSAQTTFSWVDDETTTDAEGNSQTTNYGGTNSTSYTAFTVDCSPDPGSTNVPNHDCWDKYVRASGAPSDAPLDVYCGWDTSGNPMAGERFWEIRGPANGTNPSGHTTPTGPVNPFCAQCGGSGYTGGLVWSYLSQTTSPPACGLEQVNDSSIAVDPTRMYTNSDGDKVFKMGSYSGTMRVRNWLTGGVNALSNAIKNFGNPYFSECDVARPDEAGTRINQEFE